MISYRIPVLISAYACEPNSGSEPGVGWSAVEHLSAYCQLTVITRENNRETISQTALAESVNWLYVDGPKWLQQIKTLWPNVGRQWYYAVWQVMAWRRARQQLRHYEYALVHHVTFMRAGVCMAPLLGIPSIIGPVGGLVDVPRGFARIARRYVYEFTRRIRNRMRWLSPLWRYCLTRADIVLITEMDTLKRIPKKYQEKAQLQQVAPRWAHSLPMPEPAYNKPIRSTYLIMCSGVHEYWKGHELILRSFHRFLRKTSKNYPRLLIAGSGRATAYLKRLTTHLDMVENVDFPGWLSEEEYAKQLANAHVYAFASLHETTGVSLLEAMAAAKAVVVLHHGGPTGYTSEENAVIVRPKSIAYVVEEFAAAFDRLDTDSRLRETLGRRARSTVNDRLNWDRIAIDFHELYSQIGERSHEA